MSTLKCLWALAMAICMAVPATAASKPSVGVFGGSDGEGVANVVSDLEALGVFSSVTRLRGNESAQQLSRHDAILVYSNWALPFPRFGDALADYVDAGGGLVAATFLYQTIDVSGPYGRLSTEGYLPYSQYLDNYEFASLGNYDRTHPIMKGPLSINGISAYYRDRVTLSQDARLVASWDDGTPLVAIDGSGVVGVFLFPNDVPGQVQGSYMNLFGNALVHAATPVPEPATVVLMLAGLSFVGCATCLRSAVSGSGRYA